MKIRVKWQVEITSSKTKCYSWKLDDHYYHVNPLIHFHYSFHQLSYFEFAVCTINKMKFENKSEMASWNNFKQNKMLLLKLDDHYYHVNPLIHLYQLSYFEFAVCTIDKMKFEYKSEMASWNNFKQNIVLHLEIGWPKLSCWSIDTLPLIAFTNFSTLNLQFVQ